MTRRSFQVAAVTALLAGAAAAVLWVLLPAGPTRQALDVRERAMEVLGGNIAARRPKASVLVLSNPFTREAGHFSEISQFEHAALRGLRRGLGRDAVVKPVFPDVRAEYRTRPETAMIPPDSRTPLSFLIRPDAVAELAEAHPEFRVIVSLIGLPIGVEGLNVWDAKDPRCFALLLPDLRLLGGSEEVAEAFRREKVLAAVVPDAETGAPLLVTRDNFAEVMRKQPGSLGF